MIACLIIFIIVVLVLGLASDASAKKELDERERDMHRARVRFDNCLITLEEEYGKCTKRFDMRKNSYLDNITLRNQILFFNDSSIVVIKEQVFQIENILSYKVSDNGYDVVTSNTKTSTGSMVGRALVGGVLLGGVGALAGAATAKRETVEDVETIHDFVIKIFIKGDDNTPKTYQVGDNQRKVDELTDYLDCILMSRENLK